MNKGGFSWRRFLGLSAAQANISRKMGIPISRSGRQRKIGAIVEKFIMKILGINSYYTKNKTSKFKRYILWLEKLKIGQDNVKAN